MVDDDGVTSILHTVLLVSGSAVMSVQCEQEGAEHITLGSSGVGLVYYLDQQPHLYSHSYCLYQASTCFFCCPKSMTSGNGCIGME